MTNLKIFIHCYDKLYSRAIENLTNEELKSLVCYAVEKNIDKYITTLIQRINEWELSWNDYSYREKKYYDYGIFAHLLNNNLVDGLTHIVIIQYDSLFEKNAINQIKSKLSINPNTIFYNNIRGIQDLWLTEYEFINICNLISEKMKINVNPFNIIKNGWISETFSIVPIHIFTKFAEFIIDNKLELEEILEKNRWGIMNSIKHRMCGIIERMWGFYLISCDLQLEKMPIQHDHNFYYHQHEEEK
jgi:hypothetical protein